MGVVTGCGLVSIVQPIWCCFRYHSTPSVSGIYALREALALVAEEVRPLPCICLCVSLGDPDRFCDVNPDRVWKIPGNDTEKTRTSCVRACKRVWVWNCSRRIQYVVGHNVNSTCYCRYFFMCLQQLRLPIINIVNIPDSVKSSWRELIQFSYRE